MDREYDIRVYKAVKDNSVEYLLISFLLEINMEFDANYKILSQEREEILKNMKVLKGEMNTIVLAF